ncbi:hypothetical protein COD91_04815 [Bacillus cereus]|nr:hypothetical protein COD91_04815 [Bacillus cereus]
MDNGCGIFVKIITNLWRNGLYRRFFGYIYRRFKYINDFFNISTYQQITTERGCSFRASSFYFIKQICF